ncbi:DMT family transporter [Prevotella sp. A2931]|uniref:DMT family transporter n=1 Tax=Prevotella illustrans TaxID=2800387 RepID=A0ABS3M2V5_9BACT|nr:MULTISPECIES: DMT family transporter [Prevotella]MBO1362416.1 DMT family transporter [Prevotella illustrans]PTL25071.1 EamA/RhaT family transporter [Prevotella sp. oral taxon 820]
MTEPNTSIFQRPLFVSLFALLVAIAWGWAYPLIKLGFHEFGITPGMTGSKMLFAGVRFSLAGIIILLAAKSTHRTFRLKKAGSWWYILLFCLINTTLHYAFFYFGLSHSAGSRAAILNSMSVFLVVIFACVFFKSDKMTLHKLLGCILGFAGILSLNLGSVDSGRFTWLGDGMIILNALCGATASLMIRGLGQRMDVFVGTGVSLTIGGVLLIMPGVLLGGHFPQITILGCIYLLFLIGISTLGFTLYNKLLTCNPVGKVAIYNSLIPIVGAVTSCICLQEPFYWKYVIAGLLSASGIFIINRYKG